MAAFLSENTNHLLLENSPTSLLTTDDLISEVE